MQDLRNLRALTTRNQRKFIQYLRWLIFKQAASQLPMRFAIIQAAVILVMIIALPPADQLPKVAMPIMWMGSFCLALVIVEIWRLINANPRETIS